MTMMSTTKKVMATVTKTATKVKNKKREKQT